MPFLHLNDLPCIQQQIASSVLSFLFPLLPLRLTYLLPPSRLFLSLVLYCLSPSDLSLPKDSILSTFFSLSFPLRQPFRIRSPYYSVSLLLQDSSNDLPFHSTRSNILFTFSSLFYSKFSSPISSLFSLLSFRTSPSARPFPIWRRCPTYDFPAKR